MMLVALAARAYADINESGNLLLGGQAVIGGTATVQGNAFSVGGATFSVSGGTVSPPIFQSLEFLGRDHTVARIARCLALIPSPGTPGEGRGEGSSPSMTSTALCRRTLTLTLSRSTGRGDRSRRNRHTCPEWGRVCGASPWGWVSC